MDSMSIWGKSSIQIEILYKNDKLIELASVRGRR